MDPSPVPDPLYPCVFHINQACQVAIGRLQTSHLALPEIAPIFASVPRPRSYLGAVQAVHTLHTFLLDFGRAYDHRFHEVVRSDGCRFDRDRCYACVRVTLQNWSATDVPRIVERWVALFGAAFGAAHKRQAVAFGSERLVAAAHDTIERLARDCACSPATFRRRFTCETGTRPIDARTRGRLRRAFILLRTTDWKVDAIAAEVGWKSAKNFYHAFETQFGVKPAQLRRLSNGAAAALLTYFDGQGAACGRGELDVNGAGGSEAFSE